MNYYKYIRYAKHFSDHYWVDYVHNIWLRYRTKHGGDIFQEKKSNRWIFKCVRNEYLNSLYNNWRPVTTTEEENLLDLLPARQLSGLDLLIQEDLENKLRREIFNKVKPFPTHATYHVFKVYNLIQQGYNGAEIAEITAINENQVSIYKKQILEVCKGVLK